MSRVGVSGEALFKNLVYYTTLTKGTTMSSPTEVTPQYRPAPPPVPNKVPRQALQPDGAEFAQFAELILARERDLRNTELIRALHAHKASDDSADPSNETEGTPGKQGLLARGVTAAVSSLGLRPSRDILSGIASAYEEEALFAESTFAYAETSYLVKTEAANRHLIVTACNTKGGTGKTPLQTYLAVLYAWITMQSTLFVEANENDGTAHLRLGLRRGGRVLLPGAIKNHSLICEHETACRNLGKHFQTSLYALLSDPDDSKNGFSLTEFLSTLEIIDKKFAATFADPGNGFKKANEGALLLADVVLLPVVADDASTFTTLLSTMKNLFGMGHHAKLQRHSLIVINGTREGDTIERFLKKIREIAVEMTALQKNPETQMEESSVWTTDPDQFLRDVGFTYDEAGNLTGEKIFMVPYSQWIKDGKPVSILPEDTGLDTLTAYAAILHACLVMKTQTKEEKRAEINRRLRDRGELAHDDTISAIDESDVKRKLIEKLVAMEGGDAERAAYGILKEYQPNLSPVH